MKLSSTHLKAIEGRADLLKIQAGELVYNVKNRRVTHTRTLIPRIRETLGHIQYETTSLPEFIHDLRRTLFYAQCGPTEIEANFTDGEIFIQGTFDMTTLHKLVVVIEQPTAIDLEAIGGKTNAQE
jgi:hypothetical protein